MKETINQRIGRLRRKSGYTQEEMANILGVHIATYSRLERKGHIHCDLLIKLAEILNTDALTILYGENTHQKVKPIKPTANFYNDDLPPFIAIDRFERGTIISMRSVSDQNKQEIFAFAINKLEEEQQEKLKNRSKKD